MVTETHTALEDRQAYHLVAQAINYLAENYARQPDLAEIAAQVHLSEYHFQRLFSRWVGISPKRFVQYLTKENAKEMLRNSSSLLDASYTAGLSGPGRLHDLFVTWEAVTPGEYKQLGEGLDIQYGFPETPFGPSLLAMTPRGVCHLSFLRQAEAEAGLLELQQRWPQAAWRANPGAVQATADDMFRHWLASSVQPPSLHLFGTPFQLKVWEALLQIPTGQVVTYESLAVAIGSPRATQAVGQAVGHNPVPVLIPCHRVIRKSGELGGYRWGSVRKRALLGWEAALREVQLTQALSTPLTAKA